MGSTHGQEGHPHPDHEDAQQPRRRTSDQRGEDDEAEDVEEAQPYPPANSKLQIANCKFHPPARHGPDKQNCAPNERWVN